MDGTLINVQFNDKVLTLRKKSSKKLYKPQITNQEIGNRGLSDSERESFHVKFKVAGDW